VLDNQASICVLLYFARDFPLNYRRWQLYRVMFLIHKLLAECRQVINQFSQEAKPDGSEQLPFQLNWWLYTPVCVYIYIYTVYIYICVYIYNIYAHIGNVTVCHFVKNSIIPLKIYPISLWDYSTCLSWWIVSEGLGTIEVTLLWLYAPETFHYTCAFLMICMHSHIFVTF